MSDWETGNFGGNNDVVEDAPGGSGGGACFNCNQPGHMKADCPEPQSTAFRGECRACGQEGHRATDCPDKPAAVCSNCKEDGHTAHECKKNRVLSRHHVADKLPDEAWQILTKASEEKDIDDFKEGVQVLSKAQPDMSYLDLEKELRAKGMKVYLIALTKDVGDTYSVINLQGKHDCKFAISYQLSEKPTRTSLKGRWPATPEENLERLDDAGIPLDRGVPKCTRCGEMGHSVRACEQERVEVERVEVKCVNCDEAGHRVRDCPIKRKDKFACRNCGGAGHKAEDCDQPRSAEGVECKRCKEIGHFVSDCPQPEVCRNCGKEGHQSKECEEPRNPANVTCKKCEQLGHFARDCPNEPCRNCDELGHKSRECTKPKDWSRVTCSNCGEKGHGAKRCKQPPKAENEDNGFGDTNGGTATAAGDWNNGDAPVAAGDWGASTETAPVEEANAW